MEAATLPAEQEQETDAPEEQEQEQDGAPIEGAEATRTTANLFQYSETLHAGAGALECEHRDDGECKEKGHFHAWLCLPNSIQHRDILEKAKAAKARRKRALTDSGLGDRGASDAYVIVESELDDLMGQERGAVIQELAEREARRGAVERIRKLIEDDERFENYWQDIEEHTRLKALPEEERPSEEWDVLDAEMTAFEEALDEGTETATKEATARLESLDEAALRQTLRDVRIAGDTAEANTVTYWMWMGFICARRAEGDMTRVFKSLEEFRNAPPEVVAAVDTALKDLEGRLQRGEAAGN